MFQRFLFLIVLVTITATTSFSQDKEYKNFIDPDEILIGDRKVPKVLLVGTFHFSYPNLDAHKTAEEDQINMLSDQKQKELQELLDYLAKFKPTKIVVETGRNTGFMMRKYERWQAGTQELSINERDQIGLRLVHRFGLDTIYGCDARSLYHRMYNHEDTGAFRPFLREMFNDFDFSDASDPLDALYDEYYDYDDRLITRTNLLDYFKYMNDEKVVRRSHGAYLVSDFKLDNERGADILSMFWYSRNLRIFRKIQQIGATGDDRILVLFGAGHLPILKTQFESSPEFELIEFNSLEDQ